MKTFVLCLLIAISISLGITFLLFDDNDGVSDPIRIQYADTFAVFANNAEEMYSQYDTDGLDILQTHQAEGLRVLKLYGNSIQMLQPYMEIETLFSLFREHGTKLEELLELFQPAAVAEAYTRFGTDGLRYISDIPEAYFLLEQYGEQLVQLANNKGQIVFTLIKKHPPEFIELYYDDVLFETISRFGVDGLMALKTYRGMASTIFRIFADDKRFTRVLQTYGHRQVIPVLYYFYQTQSSVVHLTESINNFSLHALFQKKSEELPPTLHPEQTGNHITIEHSRLDRARWALQQMYESGNTFLRQFTITENGNAKPLEILTMANVLENIILGDLGRQSSSQVIPDASGFSKGSRCEQLKAALDILGLLPYETIFSKQARCLYLQTGLPEVTSLKGIEGLMTLEQYEELVEQYGENVIPFVAQYGRDGIRLLQETDGEILQFAQGYGNELIRETLQYGIEVFELVKKYGVQMLEAILATDGEVIPYVQKYGNDVFTVLAQPEGEKILALSTIFGEDVLQYAARYPDNFFRYLLKYGNLTVRAFRNDENAAVNFARQYGDDVILYLGLYENNALHLIKKGHTGVTLLRSLPAEYLEQEEQQLFRYGMPGIYASLLLRHPQEFHHYIGTLGETSFAGDPRYSQLIFWTVLMLTGLYLIRWGYKILRYLFSSGE